MRALSPSRNGGFRARSRNTPQSRRPSSLQETVAFAIVGCQSPTLSNRPTFLLGSIDSRTQSTPARIRIVTPS